MIKADSIIFDMDGTLWDATKPICEIWNETLRDFGNIRKPISLKELEGCMGLPMDKIADKLFYMVGQKERNELLEACCIRENDYLAQNGATLYDKVEETIKALSKDFKLAIVSNCQDGYIQSFIKAYNLKDYFVDFECFGASGLLKDKNIKNVVERNGFKAPVYVGDTQGDMLASYEAGVKFIFAGYGFGEAEKYDEILNDFAALCSIVEKI